jgi:signal transduction histidine kinase
MYFRNNLLANSMRYVYILILLFIYSNSLIAQKEVSPDSLIKYYKHEAWNLKQSNGVLATAYLHKGLQLAKKHKKEIDIGYFYRKLISQKGFSAQIDSAAYFFEKGLAFYNSIDTIIEDRALPAHLHSEMGEMYHRNENIPKARFHYKKADSLYAAVNDSIGVMIIKLNLGNIHYVQGEFPEAIKLYIDGAKMADTTQYLYIKGNIYNGISSAYAEMDDLKNSKIYAQKHLELALKEKDEYPEYVVNAYTNLAGIEIELNNLSKSLEYLNLADAFIIEKEMEAPKVSVARQRASIFLKQNKPDFAVAILEENYPLLSKYKGNTEDSFRFKYTLGKAYMEVNNPSKAFTVLEPLEILADSLQMLQEISYINKTLALLYAEKGEFQKAYLAQKKFQKASDSLFTIEKQKSFKDIETQYQTAEKEKTIAETRANLAEKELEVEQKNILIFGSLGLALILGLIGFLFYNQQKLKNQQLQKEGELKTALAKVETQNRLQEQRLRISRDLHDNIGSQLTFIISSIDNLKFGLKDNLEITKNKLSSISQFTSQTIFELRDTIWAMNKTDITIEDLQARISNFIEKARTAWGTINFNFSISEELSKETHFTSIQGMNMYRIIQEAVNNALKYANAKNINISIIEENDNYKIEIKDDGNGFDALNTNDGNGINNMKKRAKELGGNLTVLSDKDNGTRVLVIF